MNVKKNIIQMFKEKELGWFGHVMRTGHERLLRLVFVGKSESRRRRGRPRKTWTFEAKVAMLNRGLTFNDSLNRVLWRKRVFC